MNRLRQLALSAVLFTMVAGATIQAHDEPPKTVQEKTDQERIRVKTSTLGVERQHVWVIKPSRSGQAIDSSLWYTNQYERAGNLVEQTVYDTSGNARSTSTYDEHNLWLEELSYVGDSLDDRTVFVYNRNGLVSHIVSYDCHGRTTGQLDYEYPADSQSIHVTKRTAQDSLQYTIRYTYEVGNTFRHQMEAVQTNADGSLRMKVDNQYADDLRVKKLVFGSDGQLTHSFSYTYTPEGDFNEIVKRTATDSVASVQSYQYTPGGLVISISERDGSGLVTRTLRYVYDYFAGVR